MRNPPSVVAATFKKVLEKGGASSLKHPISIRHTIVATTVTQGQILAVWTLAAKLPNSDLNLAVDFGVMFLDNYLSKIISGNYFAESRRPAEYGFRAQKDFCSVLQEHQQLPFVEPFHWYSPDLLQGPFGPLGPLVENIKNPKMGAPGARKSNKIAA